MKMYRFLFAFFLCMLAVNAHAGTEKIVTSRCGLTGFRPIVIPATGISLEIQDQWYSYMQANPFNASNPNRWDEIFRVKNAKSRVVLRYDDHLHYAPSSPWVLRITYNITTYDSSGSTTVRNGEIVEITYDPASGTSYTDIAMNEYTDAHRAVMTITNVQYWSNGNTGGASSATIPAELADIYLDLENEVERFYSLGNTAPDVMRYSNTTEGTLWLGWDYIQGAESYDVEWLFIDAGTQALTSGFAYDWKNATRVNVAHNHYAIELAYPKGILLARVRPVGVDYRNFVENGFVTRYAGTWSYANETGNTSTDATAISNANARTDIATGREEDINWQYSTSFAEDGKRKDAISFYDGSMYGRQSVTRSNTDSTLIVAETRYDSEGRPVVSILPTPVETGGTVVNVLNYQGDFNPNFDLADFDYDARVSDPNPMDTTTSATDGTTTGQFYSGTNTETDRGQQFQATTGGYAYTQVQFKNDGTNRPSAEGGVGPNHAIGSGHEVRYYYGTPTGQVELDRLFGNEVGYVEHYQKNLVVDPNGVVSVTYLDQEGRVIATALGGSAPDSLLPLDYTDYTPAQITANLLGNNTLNQNNEKVSYSTVTVVGTNVNYDFDYTLGLDTSCGGDCYNITPCKECRYDLSIEVRKEDGTLVTPITGSNPIVATNIGSGSYSFTMQLNTGVYTVKKTLRLNESYIAAARADFIATQLAGDGCIDLVNTTPEPCALDCHEACFNLYKRRIGTTWHYYDANGDELTGTDTTQALTLIDDCQLQMCDAPPMPDVCELRYNNMLLDMAPGGQYFDNLPDKWVFSATAGGLIPNTSYDENEWLEAHHSESDMLAAINADWTGTDFTTWDQVRANWDVDWAALLIPYHPEYCTYEYYCLETCSYTPDGETTQVVLDHDDFYAYEQLFFYSTDGNYPSTTTTDLELFNPTALTQNSTSNGATSANASYQPNALPAWDKRDPRFLCDFTVCDTTNVVAKNRLQNYLKNFLPVFDNNNNAIGYHSIWYVLADPDNIAGGNAGLSTQTVDFYQYLHGDGTNDGILTTANGTITPFQFFAGVYGFYRQLVIDQGFLASDDVQYCQSDKQGSVYGYIETEDTTGPVSAGGFTVYFPENNVLHLFGDPCNAYDTAAIFDSMMVYIDDLYTQFDTTELTLETSYTQASCSCENLLGFIAESDLNDELAASNYTAIAAALNNSLDFSPLNNGDYTATEVQNWITECNETEPDWVDLDNGNFPEDLACPPETTTVAATNVYELLQDECEAENGALADLNDSIIIYAQINAAVTAWEAYYRSNCLSTLQGRETFTVDYTLQEYQYTLYYYDQAGTLVKTVPPEGVRIITSTSNRDADAKTDFLEIGEWRDHWKDHAYDGTALPSLVDYTPGLHGMITNYQYNSLQQPVQSKSPDITSETKFYYDYLGRLIVSQDARQRDLANDAWSYIRYDALGRIYESGEIINTTAMTDAIARATTGNDYAWWLTQGTTKQQVVKTQYETSLSGVATLFPDNEQKNTRNRVTSITWEATDDNNANTWDNASHYSYDIHGNVDYLIQENKSLVGTGQHQKHIRYEYDLISGNVHAVHYQEGEFDEFHHKYEYDADNRVTATYSSRNGTVWEKEQKNFYYLTGPLQRQEIGDKTVQAMDYAYTAQGWIKVMNAGSISATRDMGRDAYSENISGATSTNMYFGQDASGFVLNYFSSSGNNGDYWAPALTTAGTTDAFLPGVTSVATRADYFNLYNGNIASMVTSLTDQNENAIDNQVTAYKYDQLNRIKQVRAHRNFNTTTNQFTGATGDDGKYKEDFVFDRNGNIVNVDRNGNNTGGTQVMDDFTYYYYDNTGTSFGYAGGMPLNATNRLAYVTDGVTSTNYTTDIDNQSSNNYTYDGNGNLTADPSEQIASIAWYANGKIKSITRTSTSTKPDLEFVYDVQGNRIVKIVKPRDGTNVLSQLHWTYTYYTRDASGNVMAVYERTFEHGTGDDYYDKVNCAELHIYGSKRVGMLNADSLTSRTFTDMAFTDNYGNIFNPSYWAVSPATPCTANCKVNYRRELGNKQYEVSNHLGNVLATVSDRRLSEDNYSYTTWSSGTKYAYDAIRNTYYQDATSGTYQRTVASSDNRTDWYTADVVSYSDYFAFGAQMDGRFGGQHRYTFNGEEKDSESDLMDFGARIYNAHLGRFLSRDPREGEYAWQSTYAYNSNSPVSIVDVNGAGLSEPPMFTIGYNLGPIKYLGVGSNSMSRIGSLTSYPGKLKLGGLSTSPVNSKSYTSTHPNNFFSAGISVHGGPYVGVNGNYGSSLSFARGSRNVNGNDGSFTSTTPTLGATLVSAGLGIGYGFMDESVGGLISSRTRYIMKGFPYQSGTPAPTTWIARTLLGNVEVNAKITTGVGAAMRLGGYGFGLWNSYSIYTQYKTGGISGFQLTMEQGSNAYSTFGGLYGAAWGIGWELGRGISYTTWYQEFKASAYGGAYYPEPKPLTSEERIEYLNHFK